MFTVLIIEDEPATRGLIAAVLTHSGLKVLQAGNHQDALQLFRDHSDDVQLLIADIILPGASGVDCARMVWAINSSVKCLFISGYVDSVQPNKLPDGTWYIDVGSLTLRLLTKPFTVSELFEAVRSTCGHELILGSAPK